MHSLNRLNLLKCFECQQATEPESMLSPEEERKKRIEKKRKLKEQFNSEYDGDGEGKGTLSISKLFIETIIFVQLFNVQL